MKDKLEESKSIVRKAMEKWPPYAMVIMLSGGDDSLTALHVAKQLEIPFTHIMFGNTRTGIAQTTEFVRKTVESFDAKYLEADAGTAYEDYISRKGFFGVGRTAHNYAYRILKATEFRRCVSHNIRQRKRNRNVLFLNGARRLESENRKKTMISPYRVDPAAKRNVWVNIINEWEKKEEFYFLDNLGVKRNPVSELLHRSGECMCGTMQSLEEGEEAAFWFPEWGKWRARMNDLAASSGHNWSWGETMPKKSRKCKEEFAPMCTGCKLKTHEGE